VQKIDFQIPYDLIHFIYIVALSFLVGLELKAYRIAKVKKSTLGSTRTFTFIGIMGFVFYRIDLYYYLLGYLALSAVYSIYYFHKIKDDRTSIISFLIISLVYSFGPLMEIFNIWMPTLLFVLIVFVLNANRSLKYLFDKINEEEFETLGKFLLLSAVILPLLPHNKIPYLNISAFKIWLVVVIISAISYGSYIAQKYLFRNKGYMITGLLGGLYSSTATTVVLAKKSLFRENVRLIESAIILATAMMYIRLWIIAAIFNFDAALDLLLPMSFLALFGIAVALLLYKKDTSLVSAIDDRNPLELGTAFLFALLFVVMMVVTNLVIEKYGDTGLKVLSFVIGFTDIDPFILSLLTGKFSVTIKDIVSAVLIAAGSNDILKALYALIFGKGIPKLAAFWVFVIGVFSILYPYLFL